MKRLPVIPLILCVVGGLLAWSAGATGNDQPATADIAAKQKRVPVAQSPDLWATINVCDTETRPNTIGIRGSMPGLGGKRKATLYARFQVQYKQGSDNKWHNPPSDADSEWIKLGRTSKLVMEGGYSFEFKPPTDGGAHTLRGSVRFKWVRKGKVLERARELTESGHKSTAGADPPSWSAATCQISAP